MAPSSPRGPVIDYLAVGNPTVDVHPDHESVVGGTVVYASLQAARLGLTGCVIGRGFPADFFVTELAANSIEMRLQETPFTTRFRNETIGPGERRQTVHAWAGVIDLPARLPACRILHIAPVAAELGAEALAPALAKPERAEFVGLTPQGLIRSWDGTGRVRLHPVEGADQLARLLHAVVVAEHEYPYVASLVDAAVRAGAVAVVTRGAAGCEVRSTAGADQFPAIRVADPVDDTGAGDVFAAAFFVELHRGVPVATAVRFASAAAALSVRGIGARAVASRAEICALAAATSAG